MASEEFQCQPHLPFLKTKFGADANKKKKKICRLMTFERTAGADSALTRRRRPAVSERERQSGKEGTADPVGFPQHQQRLWGFAGKTVQRQKHPGS